MAAFSGGQPSLNPILGHREGRSEGGTVVAHLPRLRAGRGYLARLAAIETRGVLGELLRAGRAQAEPFHAEHDGVLGGEALTRFGAIAREAAAGLAPHGVRAVFVLLANQYPAVPEGFRLASAFAVTDAEVTTAYG